MDMAPFWTLWCCAETAVASTARQKTRKFSPQLFSTSVSTRPNEIGSPQRPGVSADVESSLTSARDNSSSSFVFITLNFWFTGSSRLFWPVTIVRLTLTRLHKLSVAHLRRSLFVIGITTAVIVCSPRRADPVTQCDFERRSLLALSNGQRREVRGMKPARHSTLLQHIQEVPAKIH